MLYNYGLKLGIELLMAGNYRECLRYLVMPVNYWRNLEYRLVYREGDFRSSDRVLDIGSPKLFSLFLADKVKAEVFATDIQEYFVPEYSVIRQVRGISPEKYHLRVEDARDLSFDDNSIDKVYSISVIQHIPEAGDTKCLEEIGRVLSKGGRCLLTVPFSPTSKLDFAEADFYWAESNTSAGNGKVFYQRRYSEDDLFTRLIDPSGLKIKKLKYVGERIPFRSGRELCDYVPRVPGPLSPLLSRLLHAAPAASWRELRKPLGAFLVLEK